MAGANFVQDDSSSAANYGKGDILIDGPRKPVCQRFDLVDNLLGIHI